MAEQAVPQFGFKPRAFWRQDAALVGDGYQVGNPEGMQGKGDAVSSFVRQLFQFFGSSNAADKGDALAFSGIFDVQQGLQNSALEDRGVEKVGEISRWQSFWAEFEPVPAPGEIHSQLVFGCGFDGDG